MSWLDEDLESKVVVLTIHETSYRAHRRRVAARCLRSAYEGGFKDGAAELETTRSLLRDSAEAASALSKKLERLKVDFIRLAGPGIRMMMEHGEPWPVVGTRVRSRREFSGIPAGTEGIVDEDYGTGVMVAWDLTHTPLPPDYAIRCTVSTFKHQPQSQAGAPLRDGSGKGTVQDMLEEV